MLAIFLKEINAFFSSLVGYLVIAVFLILLGLILFVFSGIQPSGVPLCHSGASF
jgi:hypothetical protein